MEKNIKISPIALLTSAIFLSGFGAIWYGVLFNELQMEAHRYTPEDYAQSNPAWYAGGIVISLFISWGLALLIRLENCIGIKAGIKASLRAAIGFGIPLVSYPLVFSPLHDVELYLVGLFQILISWTIAGAILGGMTKKV